jgi:hypothetical protein
MEAMNMTTKRQELMARLVKLQNEINHQDILTISAFMSDAALEAHVERYEALIFIATAGRK